MISLVGCTRRNDNQALHTIQSRASHPSVHYPGEPPLNDFTTRAAVLGSIDGGQAYMPFREAIALFPPAHYNTKPTNVPYSFWHLLEHIRITARDILDYIQDPDYHACTWPVDYWPARDAVTDDAGWNATVEAIYGDLADLRAIANDPERDLASLARNAHGNDQHTLFREILVVTDHNAYHTGEFAILRAVMNLWPETHT